MKKLFKIFGLIFAIILLVVASTYALLQTNYAKSWLAEYLSSTLSDVHQTVVLQQLTGHLPWNIQAQKITVADSQGIWLTAEDIRLHWQPLALIHNTIDIDLLSARHVEMLRRPIPPAKEEIKDETFDLENLTIPAIRLGELSIPVVDLPPELTGGEATRWQVLLQSKPASTTGFMGSIKTTSGPATLLELEANIARQIDIHATLEEQAGGLIGRLMGLNTEHAITSELEARGTIENFKAKTHFIHGDTTLWDIDAIKADYFTITGSGVIPPEMMQATSLPDNSWNLNAQAGLEEGVWNISHALLTLGNAKLEASGGFEPDTPAFKQSQLMLTIPDLARWGQVIDQSIEGHLESQILLNGPLDNVEFKLLGDGLINEHPVQLTANGTLEDEILTMPQLNIQTPELNAAGSATYALDKEEISANLALSGLSLALLTQHQLQGNIAGTLIMDGTLEELPFQIKGQITKLSGPPNPVDDWTSNIATYDIDAIYTPELLTLKSLALASGELSANAQGSMPLAAASPISDLALTLDHSRFEPIELRSKLQQTPTAWIASDLHMQTKGTQADGALIYDIASGLVKGEIKAKSSDFTALGNWLSLPASNGSIQTTITLDDAATKQAASVVLNVENLSIPSENISISTLSANATTRDVETLEALQLTSDAANIKIQDLLISTLTAKIDSQAASNQPSNVVVDLSGVNQGQLFTLSSKAKADLTGETRSITINKLQGDYGAYPYQLSQAATITLKEEAMTLSPFVMQVAGGSLTASGSQSAGKVNITAKLEDLPIFPLIDNRLAFDIDTNTDATLSITGLAAKPLVNFEAITSIQIPSAEENAVQMELQSVWDNTAPNAVIDNRLVLNSGEPLGTASLTIPARLSLLPFELVTHQTRPISGVVDLDVALHRLNSWLAPLGHELAGQLLAHVTIAGSLEKPLTEGNLSWQNGTYDQYTNGACLRDINLEAAFNPQSITITTLNATGNRSVGTLKGSGSINFANSQVDTTLTMDQLALFCHGVAKGQIAGDVMLKGQLESLAATGELALGPMTVLIPTGGEDAIPMVDTIYKRELALQQQGKDEPGIITLDIDVTLPEPVFVRGRGLDAEFEGAFRLEGTVMAPELDGKLTTKRGQLDVLGSSLSIDKGVIQFLERNPVNPYIDMVATTRANDVDINVMLSGAVSKPQLSFSSSPSLPQDEVLALLLFGRPLQKITPFQALQLAQAAATISGKSSGPSVLGLAREALGVDTLNISQDDDGDATVGAGKYVTDRIYVGVEQGTTPESRNVKTEIELTPNISAETSTGSQGGPSVGVQWRYDY